MCNHFEYNIDSQVAEKRLAELDEMSAKLDRFVNWTKTASASLEPDVG